MVAKIENVKRIDILSNNTNVLIDGHSVKKIEIDREEWNEYNIFPDKRYIVYNDSFYIGITLKNISRKRFIKLLMGKLMHKRLAEQFADFIFNRYGYYNQLFILSF